jgi:cytochrome P450
LNADAGLIVVAGSDTSSSVLTMALYSLVANPKYLDQIVKEVTGVFGGEYD